jgi:hypothetical protein
MGKKIGKYVLKRKYPPRKTIVISKLECGHTVKRTKTPRLSEGYYKNYAYCSICRDMKKVLSSEDKKVWVV